MRNLINLYVATLFVVVTFVDCGQFGTRDTRLVKEICDNTKNPSQKLATVDELGELATVVNSGEVPCPELIKTSINDLNNLIHNHKKDVCSQESANEVADYYKKYLASKDENTNTLVEFPKALKKFFISYGLKVSSFCRKQMADRLIADAQKLTTPSDFAEVADFTAPKRYIAAFMGDPSHNHLAFSSNFIKMMQSIELFNKDNHQKLLLQLSTTERIHRIQAVCERRFKPIYKDLILPLVTLSKVGFNYKGKDLKGEPNVVKQVYEWYRIVFMCEAMNKVEFFQSPEDQEKGAESDKRLVRILNKDEADKLRGEQSAIIDTTGLDFQQIGYKPQLESMPLDGTIYDSNDWTLERAIMTFRRRIRNENDPDMTRKMMNFVKDKASRGSIKIIGKLTGIKNLPVDGRLTGTDMVKTLDEYVHAVETGDSKPISFVSNFLFIVSFTIIALCIISVPLIIMSPLVFG